MPIDDFIVALRIYFRLMLVDFINVSDRISECQAVEWLTEKFFRSEIRNPKHVSFQGVSGKFETIAKIRMCNDDDIIFPMCQFRSLCHLVFALVWGHCLEKIANFAFWYSGFSQTDFCVQVFSESKAVFVTL
ncbi:MAG: hypothetical protein DRH50_04960 [Deltaproteobacteria bacterium]|nr:MAG: hypothetical protein DRH50_04960 [Deltaproteobacteria bacterium]